VALFSGKLDSLIRAFNAVVAIITLIPKELKACATFKDALVTVITRYHMTLNLHEFFQNMLFNTIFHLFDILSAIAYAVEGALD
jgi:hypothetical protein